MKTMPCKFPSIPRHPLGSPSTTVLHPSSSAIIASILLYSENLIMTVVRARKGFTLIILSPSSGIEIHRAYFMATVLGEIPYLSMVMSWLVYTDLQRGGRPSLLSSDTPVVALCSRVVRLCHCIFCHLIVIIKFCNLKHAPT